MKVAIGLLLVAVLALAWRLNAEMEVSRQQWSQITELNQTIRQNSSRITELNRTISQNTELHDKCAQEAQKEFRRLEATGWKRGSTAPYQSHSFISRYNAGLDKCFMTLESTWSQNGTVFANRVLIQIDAPKHKTYAVLDGWIGANNEKEIPQGGLLQRCILMPSSPTERSCRSEVEYKAFVAQYMQ